MFMFRYYEVDILRPEDVVLRDGHIALDDSGALLRGRPVRLERMLREHRHGGPWEARGATVADGERMGRKGKRRMRVAEIQLGLQHRVRHRENALADVLVVHVRIINVPSIKCTYQIYSSSMSLNCPTLTFSRALEKYVIFFFCIG